MNCSECSKIFASGLTGVELQVEVDKKFPNFACEVCSISPHSPGPVHNDERAIFLTIHPIHFDEKTGVLSPAAFEQLTRNDLSMLRQQHASVEEITYVRSKLAAGGSGRVPRTVDLCCLVDVNAIRSNKDGTGRTLGVYDTADETLKSHASVFVRKDFLEDRATRLEARRLALSIFEPTLVPVSDVLPAAESDADVRPAPSTD